MLVERISVLHKMHVLILSPRSPGLLSIVTIDIGAVRGKPQLIVVLIECVEVERIRGIIVEWDVLKFAVFTAGPQLVSRLTSMLPGSKY